MSKPQMIPDAEMDVLGVLLDREQGTVREVLAVLKEAGRTWSYATVATLLDRLENKGLVASDRGQLAFIYKPTDAGREVPRRRVAQLVDTLYQGEPGLLVMHLLKAHPLDDAQAKQIRSLLDEMTGKSGS